MQSPAHSVLASPFPPLLVMRETAVRSNVTTMASFCDSRGLRLAPHAKTSMVEYLIDLQLAAGAWGMTAASIRQVQELVGMGVPRILLANELVDEAAIGWIVDHVLGRTGADDDFICYVDSAEGIARLERTLQARDARRQLGVLVELGYEGGRTGVRDRRLAVQLARAVEASDWLELRGIAGYEGQLPRLGHQVPPGIDAYLDEVHHLADVCADEGLFSRRPVVTAGGSLFFDHVADRLAPESFGFDVEVILRSGCYVTHDHGVYRETSPFDGRAKHDDGPRFEPALELFASVLSRPEPTLALMSFGRRHAPIDERLPVVLGECDSRGTVTPIPGAQVTSVNDQHAYLSIPADAPLSVGALVKFGISHPCGAFDRWREIPVVDDDYSELLRVRPRL